MSKQYLNEKYCVRCPRTDATPYLRENLSKYLPESGRVLDIGCGNGRNAEFMKQHGFQVTAIDMVADYGKQCVLGQDNLPAGPFDIFLANYIFMFLDETERKIVYQQIDDRAQSGSKIMIEIYPAKDAYELSMNDIWLWFQGHGWFAHRKAKEKAIFEKE